MRTTVDLPDELLDRARRAAAREGTTLTAMLADGLQLRLGKVDAPPRRVRPLPLSEAGGGLHPWINPASNASLFDADDGERDDAADGNPDEVADGDADEAGDGDAPA